jgi:hypothetical protein
LKAIFLLVVGGEVVKIKDKIRDKLKQWLFAEELSKFETAEQNYKEAENLYSRSAGYLNTAKEEYTWSLKMVDDCHKLINSMMDVGTDVGFYSDDHSWAVVCIKGHPEYVKFIPLSHKDARGVLDFLKRFRYSDRVVDSPFGFRDMVDHCIMENPFGK